MRDLAKYGVDKNALLDGCTAAYVGAWHYKRQIAQFGNTWAAVGAYHSRTPARSAWYANQIASILMKWGVLARGPLPYTGVPLLAPNERAPGNGRQRTAVASEAAAHTAPTTVFDAGAKVAQRD